MADYKRVRLEKHDLSRPWGFRLEGGVNKNVPLHISMVHSGSIAERAGLSSGDYLKTINNLDTSTMTHEDAKMEIIRGCNVIEFTVTSRCNNNYQKKKQIPSPLEIIKDVKIDPVNLTMGENFICKNESGGIRKIMHSDYNSPKGIYSKNNFNLNFINKMQQEGVSMGELQNESSSIQGPPLNRMKCHACCETIKGTFVKVHGKFLMHPSCLKCFKCGVGLRNVGYFYINEKLFCETHAKLVATPPGPDMKPMAIFR